MFSARLACPLISLVPMVSSTSFCRLGFPSLLTRSNLRFPQRRGPPFGPSQFPLGSLHSVLVLWSFTSCGRLCVGLLLLLSFSSSCLSPLFWGGVSSFLVSMPLLFRGSLVSVWVSVPSCLSVVFTVGVSLLCFFFCSILSFLTLVPLGCCSPWLTLPTFLLSLRSLPSWTSVSFALVVFSGASLLIVSLTVSLWSWLAPSSVAATCQAPSASALQVLVTAFATRLNLSSFTTGSSF